jgi:hypothetical protein
MKTINFFFILIIILTISCKKEKSEDNPKIATHYIKGILRDSTTGNPIPDHKVYLAESWDYYISEHPLQLITDNNGVFRATITWNLDEHAASIYPNAPHITSRALLKSTLDTLAGMKYFQASELKLNDTLQTDLFLNPQGYLSLRLIDTSHIDTSDIYAIVINCWEPDKPGFEIYYYPIIHPDTLMTFNLFGRQTQYYDISFEKNWISIHSFSGNVYVNYHDTIKRTYYY